MSLISKGQVLSCDKVVASIEDDRVTVIDKERCPYFLIYESDNIQDWLADRAFDSTRGHSRTLKRISNLVTKTDAEIALRFFGATITDNYWVKTEENNNLTYEDVRYKTDQLFQLALNGDSSDLNHKPEEIYSPQFTVSGCLEKGWSLENGVWFLYKRDNPVEQFNEVFVSDVSNALGVKSVIYMSTASGVKSANFADKYNFEDMKGLIGESGYADYNAVYEKIKNMFGDEAAIEYVKLIYIDAICCNQDRHSKNFGILRDIDSGAFVSLAPNFDYNISLFGDGIGLDTKKNAVADPFIRDLCNLLDERNINLVMPRLTQAELENATQRSNTSPMYNDAIRYVMQRQQLICEIMPRICICSIDNEPDPTDCTESCDI